MPLYGNDAPKHIYREHKANFRDFRLRNPNQTFTGHGSDASPATRATPIATVNSKVDRVDCWQFAALQLTQLSGLS
jgi:hypothetical protein